MGDWSGKNDGTPGALRERQPLKRGWFYDPENPRCPLCDGRMVGDSHPMRCVRCHPRRGDPE